MCTVLLWSTVLARAFVNPPADVTLGGVEASRGLVASRLQGSIDAVANSVRALSLWFSTDSLAADPSFFSNPSRPQHGVAGSLEHALFSAPACLAALVQSPPSPDPMPLWCPLGSSLLPVMRMTSSNKSNCFCTWGSWRR